MDGMINFDNMDASTFMDNFNSMAFDDVAEEMGIDIKQDDADICPNCGDGQFVEDHARGIIVCKRCGQVIDTIIEDGAEKRYYDDDAGHARCAVAHNKLLPQSSLGTSVNVSGKLKKLQTWCAMPYKERSNNREYKKIEGVCREQKIPKMVEYDAKLRCKKVNSKTHETGDNVGKSIITRGRNRAGITAGCLFIACRTHGYTRSAREIAEYFNIEEADVNKGVASIMAILKDDPIIRDMGTSKVTDFIKRKCDELRIRNVDATRAITIGKNIEKLGIASNHTTYALAAAAILLMADINELTHITKKLLSAHFSNLTDVTIGKTYHQIQNKREILIDDAVTAEIMRRVNEKRQRRIISRQIAEKMRTFGVDTSKYVVEGEEHLFVEPTEENAGRDSDKFNNRVSDNNDMDDNYDEYDHDDLSDDLGEDELLIGMDDIVEVIEIIKEQMNNLDTIKTHLSTEEYNEQNTTIMQNREMVVEFIKEYPETLDQEDIDNDFFLNVICPTNADKKEILKLQDEERGANKNVAIKSTAGSKTGSKTESKTDSRPKTKAKNAKVRRA
jgi:transcription initiation factor TFIIB